MKAISEKILGRPRTGIKKLISFRVTSFEENFLMSLGRGSKAKAVRFLIKFYLEAYKADVCKKRKSSKD